MSKRRGERKPSTQLFITAAILGGLAIFEASLGVVTIVTGDPWNAVLPFVLCALLVWYAISLLRKGLDIRSMSMDDDLIAAAIYERMIRNGQLEEGSGPQVIRIGGGEDPDDSTATKTTGTLEQLRAARKGNNASD